MFSLLVAAQKGTLAWFLGNTFALAAWWLISGFASGIFLSMFGGVLSFMLTGKVGSQLRTERFLGVVGGALIGMSGGATVGAIGEFSGVIGMVYLWGFVGMMLAAFQSANRSADRYGEDQAYGSPELESSDHSFVSQVLTSCTRLAQGRRSPDEIMGAVCGGVLGVVYGTVTGLVVPLSATALPGEETATTVAAAAAVWAVLAGFGSWVGVSQLGLQAGLIVVGLGLVFGSSLGGCVALVGELFGEVVTGAINGGIGGAFFGAIAAHELIHKRFP